MCSHLLLCITAVSRHTTDIQKERERLGCTLCIEYTFFFGRKNKPNKPYRNVIRQNRTNEEIRRNKNERVCHLHIPESSRNGGIYFQTYAFAFSYGYQLPNATTANDLVNDGFFFLVIYVRIRVLLLCDFLSLVFLSVCLVNGDSMRRYFLFSCDVVKLKARY